MITHGPAPTGGYVVIRDGFAVCASPSADRARIIAERLARQEGVDVGTHEMRVFDTAPSSPAPPGSAGRIRRADLAVLDQSIAKLAAALATSDWDADLVALIEAEENGRTRSGALVAIRARMAMVR